MLAVLAGAETFVDFIARFATLDATEFQRRFVACVAKLTRALADVIAIDGKKLCRSSNKKGGKAGQP
ncbi:MAG TPA: hypothetical protein VHF01_04810 [Candidatus Acidoferrum sp.]|nr:hypothetical protein [Candidatus Acidoferrum sp.]